jgi:uncharacterized membrane protein YjgN (DUF898 family)
MKGKFKFTGEGGKLFCLLFVQGLLTCITFGIYSPWALKNILAYFADNLTLDGKKFKFSGDGGDMLSLFLIQGLLTSITAGLYAPVAALNIRKYMMEKITLDGKAFSFDGDNACDFWCLNFIQGILINITAGIYYPWAMINITKNICERTTFEGKKFGITADGGKLFSLYLGQTLLSIITFGIYTPWAIAKITNYWVSSFTYGDEDKFSMDLQGGELFSLMVVHGAILTGLTLGIYYPWYVCKMYAYQAEKTEIK